MDFSDIELAIALKKAKRIAEEERKAPPTAMRYISSPTLLLGLSGHREDFEERSKSKERVFRQTYIGNKPHFSTTPIEKLRPILLKDIMVRQRAEDRYLLCRIFTPPYRQVCVSVGVEDPQGWSQLLSIYNFPGTYTAGPEELDTLFPMNTILAIREPMAKMALTNDNSHIRVDSPSDIIFLDPNHPILSDVTWSNGVKQSRITKTTASGWKDIGDSHFKKRQFFASAAAYTYALRKDSTFTAARLNRCLTQLRLSNFVASLHDANRVIRTENLPEPDQIKALYRLAQAQYGAGEYPAAQNYYTRCLSIKPDQKEATEGIDKCQARIREQEEGTYDWIQLLTQTKTPGTRPDVADYMGPIAVTQMENRGGGRGVTATSDIKVGDLLLVFKAFSVAFAEEEKKEPIVAFNFISNNTGRGTLYSAFQQLVTKIALGDHQRDQILELYSGPTFAAFDPKSATKSNDPDIICDPTRFGEDIDVSRIESIFSYNAFGFEHSDHTVRFTSEIDSKPAENSAALHLLPSFINHSCLANATWTTFGHVMVIRAVQDIPKGKEVTIAYYDATRPYFERTEILSKYMKECDCRICSADRGAPSKFHKKQKEADEQLDRSKLLSTKTLTQLAKEIDSSYPPKYPQLRGMSVRIHRLLADRLEHEAHKTADAAARHQLFRRVIEHEIKALEALGIRVLEKDVIDPPNSSRQVRLPISEECVPRHLWLGTMGCLMIFGGLVGLGSQWRAEMWMRAAIWFEDKSFGGGMSVFRLRYTYIMDTFGPAAQEFLDRINPPLEQV